MPRENSQSNPTGDKRGHSVIEEGARLDEPTLRKHRTETAVDKLAVSRAFEARLSGAQFEDNAPAQEQLRQFFDACEQKREEEIELRARLVVRILAIRTSDDDVNKIAKEVVKVATGTSAKCLFDGPSIDFPLGGKATVKVLVPESRLDINRVLDRHIAPAAFRSDDARKVADSISDRDGCPLPLFYGASGSGKTTCGIAIAGQLIIRGGEPGACIRLLCSAECLYFIPEAKPDLHLPLLKEKQRQGVLDINEFEKTYNVKGVQAERNLVAQELVFTALDAVIDVSLRRAPTDERFLVVFLDEAGDYPTFVRAMCSCYKDLQDAIKARYARLVIAGTGIEGADHRVGSQPTTILPFHVRPHTWPTLKEALPATAITVKNLLDNDESTLVRIVNGMVQNARVAAILARQLHEATDAGINISRGANVAKLDPRLALKYVAVGAGEVYRRLNGRRGLSHPADFAMLLCAMAQQTSTMQLHELGRYGLLVDRAEPWHKDSTDSNKAGLELLFDTEEGMGLYLHPDFLGVRYELEAAQTMMLQLALKIGNHPPTPPGFESGVVDFVAMAMELSRKDLLMDFNFFNTQPGNVLNPTTVRVPWSIPVGWKAPLMLAARLHEHAPESLDTTQLGAAETDDINRIHSTTKLEPRDHQAPVQEYIKTKILSKIKDSRLGLIITNCPAASYADVIAFFGGTDLVLVQAKLHMDTVLSARDVFEELHKMGNRDWRAVLAMFHKYKRDLPQPPDDEDAVDEVPLWIRKMVNEPRFATCFESPPTEAVEDWLSASTFGWKNPVTEQLRQSGIDAPLRVTYVIMVYGKEPANVVSVPGDVLLLYAPDPKNARRPKGRTGTDPTARPFAAEQLWSYYPISLNPRVEPPHCDPITTPRKEQ
jgi:hypothetical protein